MQFQMVCGVPVCSFVGPALLADQTSAQNTKIAESAYFAHFLPTFPPRFQLLGQDSLALTGKALVKGLESALQTVVLMHTDVVSDSAVFMYNSPRIGPVPTIVQIYYLDIDWNLARSFSNYFFKVFHSSRP